MSIRFYIKSILVFLIVAIILIDIEADTAESDPDLKMISGQSVVVRAS